MKVKMLTRSAGPEGTLNPGDVADMPEDQAADAIARGFAVSAEPPTKARALESATKDEGEDASKPAGETASAGAAETAESPQRRGRRGRGS